MTEFTYIHIPAKVKPYVRMTQAGKYVDPQAKQYLQSKQDLQWLMKAEAAKNDITLLGKVPLQVHITFFVTTRLHGCDLDNQVKAILDAGNGILWSDDRYIDFISARRAISAEHNIVIGLGAEDLE